MKKFFNTNYSNQALSFSLLVLRLALGVLMIPHGYGKLQHFAAQSPGFGDPYHIGGPAYMGLTIFAELFCALLITMGLLTRMACIPLILVLSTNLFYSQHGQVFGAGETTVLYLAGFIALLLTGPGKISLDRMIGK